MYGNMCGYPNKGSNIVLPNMSMDMSDRPVLYWPDPLDLSIQVWSFAAYIHSMLTALCSAMST